MPCLKPWSEKSGFKTQRDIYNYELFEWHTDKAIFDIFMVSLCVCICDEHECTLSVVTSAYQTGVEGHACVCLLPWPAQQVCQVSLCTPQWRRCSWARTRKPSWWWAHSCPQWWEWRYSNWTWQTAHGNHRRNEESHLYPEAQRHYRKTCAQSTSIITARCVCVWFSVY